MTRQSRAASTTSQETSSTRLSAIILFICAKTRSMSLKLPRVMRITAASASTPSRLVHEADARVKLGIARETLLKTRHPQQDQAEPVAIGKIAQVLEQFYGQSICLVDDY